MANIHQLCPKFLVKAYIKAKQYIQQHQHERINQGNHIFNS